MLLKKIAPLASLSALAMVTMSGTAAFAESSSRVTVFNQGGYVADYQVSYIHNGQQRQEKVSGLVVGTKKAVTLPAGSHNIRVKGQMLTGLFWEPKRELFNQSARDGSCFKTYGTIFSGKWDRACTADF
jgi:cytolysin (calcineurin-like family phosphatase)